MKAFAQCQSRATARRWFPWASVITKVCGGYMCFEYTTDYDTWRNQV